MLDAPLNQITTTVFDKASRAIARMVQKTKRGSTRQIPGASGSSLGRIQRRTDFGMRTSRQIAAPRRLRNERLRPVRTAAGAECDFETQSRHGGLSCFAPIILQQPAEAAIAYDFVSTLAGVFIRLDQPILKALVVALAVVVITKVCDRVPQRFLAEENRRIDAFRFNRSHDPFR